MTWMATEEFDAIGSDGRRTYRVVHEVLYGGVVTTISHGKTPPVIASERRRVTKPALKDGSINGFDNVMTVPMHDLTLTRIRNP